MGMHPTITKDGLVQPKHVLRARVRQLLVSYGIFNRQTASRERLVLFLSDFLFTANTIAFTYQPLFELFFHRSYLNTTTISLVQNQAHTRRNKIINEHTFYWLFLGRSRKQMSYTLVSSYHALIISIIWQDTLFSSENSTAITQYKAVRKSTKVAELSTR